MDLTVPIFPFDSTAITVTTTVWIGVCIAVYFNLRLGWTLSALVVPGYLAPLVMTRPVSAGVILLEAIITYCIVLFVSELPKRHKFWSSFFGRDRFFVILVVSVLVRAVMDGWLLPYAGRIAVEQYGINFDYRNELHSFGLIVVALIANYFWKPGLTRGIMPLLTCVALTYFVVKFCLVGFTNFNVGNFHLLYEDVSTSLLASPKAYIIVLLTAYLASWFNLRYSWDFNGILIPALLGLLWCEPSKIVVSAAECLVILSLASLLLKTPWFRGMTMEGGRKLCFFFTICFVFRLVLCHALPHLMPSVELTDAFGFGYLLSTLMAIKAHGKRFTIRMFRSTAEISMLGAVAGSLIGFAFYCGPEIRFGNPLPARIADSQSMVAPLGFTNLPLRDLLGKDKIQLYENQAPGSFLPPSAQELSTFRDAVESLKQLVNQEVDLRNSEVLNQVAVQLQDVNYRLLVVEDRYLYFRETSPPRGWGVYVIDTERVNGMCLEVPDPLAERGMTEASLCLFHRMPCTALSIAGSPMKLNQSGGSGVMTSRQSMFSEFHKVFSRSSLSSILQVRGFTKATYRQQKGQAGDVEDAHLLARSQLWVRDSIAPQLKLTELKSLSGSFDILWNERPVRNRLRRRSSGFFAELILNENDRRRLIGKLYNGKSVGGQPNENSLTMVAKVEEGSFNQWMNERKVLICQQGGDGYQPAMLQQMLFMDHEVVQPLMALLSGLPSFDYRNSDQPNHYQRFWETQEWIDQFVPIQAAANTLGYEITVLINPNTKEPLVALAETVSPAQESTAKAATGTVGTAKANSIKPGTKGWGTFVFRPGLAESFAVEIPRPLFERQSFDFGVNLFDRPRASALLVAGAHPRANLDGSADISKANNKVNLFNLVRHVLLRQLKERPLLIAQARAIQAPVSADVVLATDDGTFRVEDLSSLKQRLVDQLNRDSLSYTIVDGREETAGYELGILMRATSIQVSRNKEVMSLWLSPSLRSKFRKQTENRSLDAQFSASGIPTVEASFINHLMATPVLQQYKKTNKLHSTPVPDALRDQLRRYADSFDVIALMKISQEYPGWQFKRVVDTDSEQAFLLISKSDQEFPTVLSLTGYLADQSVKFEAPSVGVFESFVHSRSLWLEPQAAKKNSKGKGLENKSNLSHTLPVSFQKETQ